MRDAQLIDVEVRRTCVCCAGKIVGWIPVNAAFVVYGRRVQFALRPLTPWALYQQSGAPSDREQFGLDVVRFARHPGAAPWLVFTHNDLSLDVLRRIRGFREARPDVH